MPGLSPRPTYKGSEMGEYAANHLPCLFRQCHWCHSDGRLAYHVRSISRQGADHRDRPGVNSAAKMDHLRTGGTLLNQKFTPSLVKGENGLRMMGNVIRTYFDKDGHHIQFNVINKATLIKAQKNPEEYRDLIVRVAGYSDYFRNLDLELQNEIINRTEHESF